MLKYFEFLKLRRKSTEVFDLSWSQTTIGTSSISRRKRVTEEDDEDDRYREAKAELRGSRHIWMNSFFDIALTLLKFTSLDAPCRNASDRRDEDVFERRHDLAHIVVREPSFANNSFIAGIADRRIVGDGMYLRAEERRLFHAPHGGDLIDPVFGVRNYHFEHLVLHDLGLHLLGVPIAIMVPL